MARSRDGRHNCVLGVPHASGLEKARPRCGSDPKSENAGLGPDLVVAFSGGNGTALERLCEIGEASRLMHSRADGRSVVPSYVDDRH
jgi:hypothetical protein